MKREEAIKLLNDIHSQCCDTANILCTLDADKRCDALQMAITALQNQPVWIPVSERLPDDGDVRFYMCIVENHEEDLPMFCQYEEDRGFGFWRDYYDGDTLGFIDSEFQTNEELGYEKVVAWMPLPEPYLESEPHQTTAYDPDKVVEQLEERTAFLKDCTKYGNKTADQQSKSYDTMMMYEVKDLVDDLLQIVKAGGADGN